MTDPWVALAADTDPGARIGQLRRAHEVFTSAGRLERPVRPVVGESWRRSARARVSPDGAALVELGPDDLGPYRDGHIPLPTLAPRAARWRAAPDREATDMTRYAAPGAEGAIVSYESRYDHWIGGAYVPPLRGQYFENPSPVDGRSFTARGTAEDVELALDAAHAAAPAWGATAAGDRAGLLNRIADRMEAHLEELAVAESWDNGKPVRETLAADIPLAIDHFR